MLSHPQGQGLAGKLEVRLHSVDNDDPLHINVTGDMVGLRDGQLPSLDDPGLRWPLWTRFNFHVLNRGNIQLTTTSVYLLPLKVCLPLLRLQTPCASLLPSPSLPPPPLLQ